jgi:hypothetical protein
MQLVLIQLSVFILYKTLKILITIWSKLQTVLQEVIQFRQKKADIFMQNSPCSAGISEYLPWTAAPGKGGLRDALSLQVCPAFYSVNKLFMDVSGYVNLDSFY